MIHYRQDDEELDEVLEAGQAAHDHVGEYCPSGLKRLVASQMRRQVVFAAFPVLEHEVADDHKAGDYGDDSEAHVVCSER